MNSLMIFQYKQSVVSLSVWKLNNKEMNYFANISISIKFYLLRIMKT